MKNKGKGIILCILMILTAVFPVAEAVNINEKSDFDPTLLENLLTIQIVAEVAYVNDPYNLLGGTIHVGDVINGEYTYDLETADTNTASTVGDYWHTSSLCGIQVNAGGFLFKTNSSDVNFLVEICNDHGLPTPRDNYLIRSYNNLPLSNGMEVEFIAWQLDDETCTALSSDALPTTAPVLTDWESIFGLTLQGYDPDELFHDFFIRAHVTKVTEKRLISLIFGKYTNLVEESGFITIEAVNLRLISFNPFQFLHYTSGEEITYLKDTAKVVIFPQFIIGILK